MQLTVQFVKKENLIAGQNFVVGKKQSSYCQFVRPIYRSKEHQWR